MYNQWRDISDNSTKLGGRTLLEIDKDFMLNFISKLRWEYPASRPFQFYDKQLEICSQKDYEEQKMFFFVNWFSKKLIKHEQNIL